MSEITEKMLEDFTNGTSNIETVIGYYGLELDNKGGVEVDMYDGIVEIYAITTDLTPSDFERLPNEWEKFVNYKGDNLYAEAEKLQTSLKEQYDDDYFDITYNVSSDLLDSFERFVANKYEEVEDFEHDFDFYVYVNVSDNSFNPEDLIRAREEELSNK